MAPQGRLPSVPFNGPNFQDARPLPQPLPAGVMPDENSRIWWFTAKAIAGGEKWIQDDTREWFENQDRRVQIRRDYPTHPRWIVGTAGKTQRATLNNDGITSEIHILARMNAGLPDVPAWAPARFALKQMNADLSYRLTRTARGVFIEKGKQAMMDFADRSPGQFLKFIANTFVPKQIDHTVNVSSGQLDPETADEMIGLLGDELKRRAAEAKDVTRNPVGVELNDVAGQLLLTADKFKAATGSKESVARLRAAGTPLDIKARSLKHVVDLEADDAQIVSPAPGEIEWD